MKLNRIKLVLVEKEVSQTQLAKDLGKSFSTINAYCSNRKQPSLDLLNKIAEYLSVNIKDLIVDNIKVIFLRRQQSKISNSYAPYGHGIQVCFS